MRCRSSSQSDGPRKAYVTFYPFMGRPVVPARVRIPFDADDVIYANADVMYPADTLKTFELS